MQRIIMIIVATVAVAWGSFANTAQADDTADSAVWLLKKTTLVHRDGRHNILLRALRQMRDTRLKPLYSELVQKRHPVMQIHGILGLGEIDPKQQIDLALVADIKDTATQTQLISSAIEAELLTIDQARQMLQWPGLTEPVRVVITAFLVSEGEDVDLSKLNDALQSDKEAIAGMTALLRLQTGDKNAMRYLEELNKSKAPNLMQVQAMLMQTAMRYEFDTIAPWAVKLAQQDELSKGLHMLAMRTALHFKAPEAGDIWATKFDGTTSPADRIRLAMIALDSADKLPPAIFDRMAQDNQKLIQQLGKVGKMIASDQDATDAILDLLDQNNLLASKWVLQYANDEPIEKAKPILVGIILAAEGEPNAPQFRAQRLENVVLATEAIAEKADDAPALIQALLEKVQMLTQEAMIMGLIRSEEGQPDKAIVDFDQFKSDTAESLALLLAAKHGRQLDNKELQQLGLIVRGGAGLQEPLRVQAAWIYVKMTDQDKVTLANVLGK